MTVVVVDSYGAFVGKSGDRFVIKSNGETKEFASEDVEQILVSSAATVSSDAVFLAAEKNVDIAYLDYRGIPVARVFPCKLGGTTKTRRAQLEAGFDGRSLAFCRAIVEAKVRNQAALLKSLSKGRGDDFFAGVAEQMEKGLDTLNIGGKKSREDALGVFLGVEGNAASEYFEALSKVLPFERRETDAKDAVNALLNYGYGVLRNEVERSCLLAGLDPFLGFFHADRYGKPSMVLDLMEPFRAPVVDRALVTLAARKQFSDELVCTGSEGCLLSDVGRKVWLEKVLERLNSNYGDRAFKDHVLRQSRELVQWLLGGRKSFEAFAYR